MTHNLPDKDDAPWLDTTYDGFNAEETARQGLLPRKLTEHQVLLIKADLASGDTLATIASRYNVSPSAINHIKHGRSWGWLKGDKGVQTSKG